MPPKREMLRWQSECLPALCDWFLGTEDDRVVVVAPTGSGKSEVIARFVTYALDHLDHDEVIVCVAPSQMLVRQLSQDALLRYMPQANVGAYYADKKQMRLVTAVCLDSLAAFVSLLNAQHRRIGLLVFDECHWTEGDKTKIPLGLISPRRMVGFSATCFLGDKEATLTMFDRVLYKLDTSQAIEDGIIVPPNIIPWTREDVPADDVVIEWLTGQYDPRVLGPAIVTASDVADAEAFAERLRGMGLKTEVASCYDSKTHIRAVLCRLRACELDCAVSVNLLSEGVDVPEATILVLRTPTSKAGRRRLVQRLGRVVRVVRMPDGAVYLARFGPKKAGIILDPTNSIRRVGIVHPERLGIDDYVEPEVEDPAPRVKERLMMNRETVMASQVPEMDAWVVSVVQRLVVMGQLPGSILTNGGQQKFGFVADTPSDRQTTEMARYSKMACVAQVLPAPHSQLFRIVAGGCSISAQTAALVIAVGGWMARRHSTALSRRTQARWEPGPLFTPEGADALVD